MNARIAPLSLGLLLLASGAAFGVNEIIVPTQMPLSVALATAQNGDTITILPAGSPYQQFPGYSFANKQLTIRGSTGNPADVVLDGANLDIVLRISGATASGSVIENLTIRNGKGADAANSVGAGIHISGGANVTLRNLIVRDNRMPGAGGAGAGVYSVSSNLVIQGCVFEHNVLASNVGDGGGLLLNTGAHLITDCVFVGNGVEPGVPFISGSWGGAIFAVGGSATITRCEFRGGRSFFGGGMALAGTMTMVIDECVFADNVSSNGAAFLIDGAAGGSTPRIRNSLFVGNTAANDAAIYTDKGGLFMNLTFVGNTATGSYIIGGGTSSAIDNCIFWGNSYLAANNLFPAHTPDVVRRCILQQAYAGAPGSGSNRVIDPLFVDAGMRDFRLQDESPAIDAGDSNLYYGPFADLDGKQRGVDIPEVPDTGFAISGAVIDIGAYEAQGEPPLPACRPDFNRDGILNSADFFDFLAAFFTGC